MKLIFGLMLFSAFMNCLLLDSMGLETRYKGSEARQRITDGVNKISAARKAAGFVDTPEEAIVFLLAPDLAGIEEDKYYQKVRIDDCYKRIVSIQGVFISPLLPILFECNLKPDGILLQDE
ncbi:TIGR04452 family lipoprotein [Leptospira sp. WS92.C1]